MRSILGVLLGVLTVVCQVSAAALDLPYLVQSAFVVNETLAMDQESITQAEQRYAQAMGSLAPVLGLAGSYQRQDDSKLAIADQRNARVTLAQPLLRGFREYAAIRAAKAGLAYQDQARRWGRSRVALDVAQAYANVLVIESDRAVFQESIELYEKRIQDLKKWVGIGRSRPNEVLNAQAAQAGLKAQAAQAEGQSQAARELLGFLCGIEPDQELLSLPEALPELPVLAALQASLPKRADLNAAEKAVEQARAQVGIARGGHGPNVDLSANYYLQREGALKDVTWDATLSASLPLFAGFTVSKQVKQAQSALRQAELNRDRATRSALADIRALLRTLRAELAQVQALREAQELSEKNYQADAKDYTLGLVTNVQVLQSLANAKDTQRALARARTNAWIDARRLDAAAGQDQTLIGER